MKFFLVQYHVINLVPGKGHYYLMFRVNQCQRIENKKGGVKIANLPCHLQLLFIVTQHNLMSAKMSGNLFWNLQAEKKMVNKHKKSFYSDGALVKIDHTIQDFFKIGFLCELPFMYFARFQLEYLYKLQAKFQSSERFRKQQGLKSLQALKKGQLQVKSSTEYLFKVIFELTHNKLGTVLKFHAISMKSSDQPK